MSRFKNKINGVIIGVDDSKDHRYGGGWERVGDSPEPTTGPVLVGEATVTIVPPSAPSSDSTQARPGGEPPRSGKGSGRDAWADHAAGLGIEVTDEATRDEIIKLVDAHTAED